MFSSVLMMEVDGGLCQAVKKNICISETGTWFTTQKGKLTSGQRQVFSAKTKSVKLIVFHVEITADLFFFFFSKDGRAAFSLTQVKLVVKTWASWFSINTMPAKLKTQTRFYLEVRIKQEVHENLEKKIWVSTHVDNQKLLLTHCSVSFFATQLWVKQHHE